MELLPTNERFAVDGRHISASGASPEPGASLQRIGELLFEERSNGLPATGMRLHIAVVGRSNVATCFAPPDAL